MSDLLTLLEFVNKVFVQFTLDLFKGSVILCIICVCVQGMLGNNIRNLENPVLGNRRLGITKMRMLLPRNPSEHVTSCAVGLHSCLGMTIPPKYGLYVMEWSKYAVH